MLNVKYLAFDTPNTKKPFSSGVLNAKIFGMSEQYNLKYGKHTNKNGKIFIIFSYPFTFFLDKIIHLL